MTTVNICFLWGVRNQESASRSGYLDEWKNEKWGKRDWNAILPIRHWTDEDVWLYTIKNGLDINTKYKKGYERVGCAIACPFYTKSTWVLDKYWYPKGYKRWQDILYEDFVSNNKWIRMNCTLKEYFMNWNGGAVREEPTEDVVKEFAEYKNLDYDVAKKYFSNKCCICDKKIKIKNDIAMNMKFNGRNSNKLFCKKAFERKFGY